MDASDIIKVTSYLVDDGDISDYAAAHISALAPYERLEHWSLSKRLAALSTRLRWI